MSTLLRLPIVSAESGLSKTTIYARIADGTFPPPVKLGPRAVTWAAPSTPPHRRAPWHPRF